MSTEIDTIHTRELATPTDTARSETRLVRVDVSGVSLSDVQWLATERGDTRVHVERRNGTTYLVGDRRPSA